MKQHVYAVAELEKAAEKSRNNAKKETERAGLSEYQRLYHLGRSQAAETVRFELSTLRVLGDSVDEATVKKLASNWRTKSLLLLQQAFKAEADKRYESRLALGQQYTYALAAIELERLLKSGAPQVTTAPATPIAS